MTEVKWIWVKIEQAFGSGFDEEWCEVFRDYDEEAVAELVEWLEEHAVEVEDDFYAVYHFEGFEVHLGYGSYDI